MSIKRLLVLLLSAVSANLASAKPPADTPRGRIANALEGLTAPDRLLGFQPHSEKGKRGLEHILTGRALGGPVPYWVYRRVDTHRDPVTRWLAEGTLPSPFVKDKRFPVGLGEAVYKDRYGIELISKSCLECHAGTAAGYEVMGMGNSNLDVVPLVSTVQGILAWDPTSDTQPPVIPEPVARASGIRPSHGEEDLPPSFWGSLSPLWIREYYRYVRDYKQYVQQFLLPPYRYASTRGDNLGPYGVWLLAANMADPSRSGVIPGDSNDPRTKPYRDLMAKLTYETVDPQPWWNARFKKRAYWFWDSPNHAARDFHLNFYYPQRHVDNARSLAAHKEKFKKHLDTIDDVMQYVKEVPVPALPPAAATQLTTDWAKVLRGQTIFHGGPNSTGAAMQCSSCHGSYRHTDTGIDVRYSNPGLIDVGTDGSYNQLMRTLTPIVERQMLTKDFYGDDAPTYSPVTKSGYAPPVLTGLWASAPYLHNGAVPTLEDMLTPPATRPEIWGRIISDPTAYDMTKVGINYQKISQAEWTEKRHSMGNQSSDAPDSVEFRRFYNTHRRGRSNQGHPFGTNLDAGEKEALIQFLLSLAPMGKRTEIRSIP